jgi:hypothetical protein
LGFIQRLPGQKQVIDIIVYFAVGLTIIWATWVLSAEFSDNPKLSLDKKNPGYCSLHCFCLRVDLIPIENLVAFIVLAMMPRNLPCSVRKIEIVKGVSVRSRFGRRTNKARLTPFPYYIYLDCSDEDKICQLRDVFEYWNYPKVTLYISYVNIWGMEESFSFHIPKRDFQPFLDKLTEHRFDDN